MPDSLSQTFAALADPTRRALLAHLSKGPANVSDLAHPFRKQMSLPAITKHLQVLEKAGLITKTRDAQWRPCQINGDPLKHVAHWMEQYRTFWEESFDRLEAYLKTVTSREPAKEPKMPAKTSHEIRITRLYDAPVNAVWDAWTDPQQVAKWWGPRGFTLTTHSKDLRPGGHWSYTMHGPDGTDYPNTTQYLEVEKHARLVYDHGGHDDRPPLFRVTVLFSESRGKTKMDMSMTLPTPEAAEETRTFIRKAGGNATWDRLAEYLEKESTGREAFIINRSFDAPLDRLFEMWTNPDHFTQWLPPTGMTMRFLRADIRPGGTAFYVMEGHGIKMYGTVRYLKIQPPDLIVYTQEFSDEQGNVSRHPKLPTWPASMTTTVTLTAEGPDQTRVTVTWEPVSSATPAELEVFTSIKAGMNQGWTGSFDKLEELLLRA